MGLLVPRPSISNLLQSATSVITKCDSLFYYKMRQVLLQNATAYFVTKCDRFFITKCDRYYHRAPTQSVCVEDRHFIINVVVYRLPHLYWYIGNYVYKSMINKRSITLPVLYSRPFTPKAVFWAILKEFEFAVDCSYSQRRTYVWAPCGITKCDDFITKCDRYYKVFLFKILGSSLSNNFYNKHLYTNI